MQDLNKVIQSLHPLERSVLPFLKNGVDLQTLVQKTKLKEVEVMRALQWFENKHVLKIISNVSEVVELDHNGKRYMAEEGLPERRFLTALKDGLTLDAIKKKAKLEADEFNIAFGLLRKRAAITISADKTVKLTDNGKKLLDKEFIEESFLKKLPLELSKFSPEDKFAYNELRMRKGIIKTKLVKVKSVELTKLGEELSKLQVSSEFIDALTPQIIKAGAWKSKNFRRYDVSINVPRVYPGKRHFVNEVREYAKRVWLDLGFKEMKGTMVQTSFWNFDALFTAQDHPVRELQDTFFLKDPAKGKLPNKELVERVRKTHENGWTTGSIGWRYSWNPEEAKKNVLRTHTTVLSGRTIAALKQSDLPAKFFSLAKNFRNEALDWSHLFEFYQFEGIVVDPDANLKHLMGYLKEFYVKLGYDADKIRFKPAYFPYTEPSMEVEYFHPVKKEWIELCGSGIFRPEMVKPLLGKDVPVLAWGGGFERSVAEYFKITDIRDLYKNDLKQLREMKLWL
ncbi:MAG: phenylalanine--tRNA ligase subunit alpha [Candidatus Nanoarchaeia archaeon]